jgi:TRAP-type C4-dicarboxylate transport system permease small subunit
LKSILDKLERAGRLAENTALVVLLAAMVGVSVFQIANRQLFGGSFSLSWADEFVKIIVLWLAMVGSIAAARDNKHIRIDLITHILSGPVVAWAKIIVDVFAAAVCAVIGWHAFRLIREEISWGDTIFTDVPLWIMHAIVPLAFALISYQFVVRVMRLVHELFSAPGEETES